MLVAVACNSTTQSTSTEPEAPQTEPYVEVMDSALYALLDPQSPIETLASGYTWSEGPVWVGRIGKLLFSDVPENTIYQWSPTEGASVYLQPSGFTAVVPSSGQQGSNGLMLNQEGRLVLCQHGDRRVALLDEPLDEPMPGFITLASTYQGKRLNSPNDLAFDQAGRLYFTDPPYGLKDKENDSLKEVEFNGVYMVNDAGETVLIIDDLTRPNGIAFAPDYQTLYIAQSDPDSAIWMAYPVNEDGTVGPGELLYNATSLVGQDKEKGLPDGLKVHPTGNLFASGPGGIWVISAEGKALGKIRTGQSTANCAFDDAHKYLYMTADSLLMRIALK